MFEASVAWAKEYGDVLGTIGFLFALMTVILTNGRLIIERFKSVNPSYKLSKSNNFQAINSGDPRTISESYQYIPDYGGKIAIAVTPPKLLFDVAPHFADGLADDLIADLQQIGLATPDIDLVVNQLDESSTPQSIAQNLGVGFILSTSVRIQGPKQRVAAKLIAPTGAVVWSDRYDMEGEDAMALQAKIASKVVKGLADFFDIKSLVYHPENGRAFQSKNEVFQLVSSTKSRFVAFLLCLPPMGLFGAHRFYVGRPYTGTLYILTVGILTFGFVIDLILILSGLFADGKGKPVRFWRPSPLDAESADQANAQEIENKRLEAL